MAYTHCGSVLDTLQSDADIGLSDTEVVTRIKQYGKNELEERGGKSPFLILSKQFASAMQSTLRHLLLPETTTPEMLMAKLAGQKPSNYEQLLPDDRIVYHTRFNCTV